MRGARFPIRLLAALLAGLPSSESVAGEARFTVRNVVVNPAPSPFSATIGTVGAGARFLRGGGFEPIVFRDRIVATANSPDAVLAGADAVSASDTLREGALDGAHVRIYRIENGAFRLVRTDRVAPGGHRASGWVEVSRQGMIPGVATTFAYAFPSWHRPDAETWFALRAVGQDGGLSDLSEPVAARSPARAAQAPDVELQPRPDARSGRGRPPPAPEEFAARQGVDGRMLFSWRPSAGAVGYVLLRTQTPPGEHRGYGLRLAGGDEGPPIRAGDLVFLSKTFHEPRRGELLTDRVWNATQTRNRHTERLLDFWPDDDPGRRWRYAPHEADSPVEEGGETYLEVTLARGQTARLGDWIHGSVQQEWREVLEPGVDYRIDVWLRSDRPRRVSLRFGGPLRDAIRVSPIAFDVGPEWRRHQAVFSTRVLQKDGPPGRFDLELVGEGVFGVDNLRIHRADETFLDFSRMEYARLAESGFGALRTHSLIKTGRRTYDIEQLTNPGGVANHADRVPNTLPQLLDIMVRAGVDPWLQIEPHLSPEEWLGLVEYLAAPFDPARHDPRERPWAAKRHAQGRVAPWTEAFGRILLEIGNETWLHLFEPWIFSPMTDAATGRRYGSGGVLGLYTEFVLATLRASPYWTTELDAKVEVVLGGWARVPQVSAEAAAAAPSVDHLMIAPYNDGWDAGEGPPTRAPESYFGILNQAAQSTVPMARALRDQVAAAAGRRASRLRFGTYEAGPGYAMDGLGGFRVSPEQARVQEEVMKSQAAGVATLDSFLALAAEGFDVQNFFTFSEGALWSSHAYWHRGGAAYPQWTLLSLFNREALGDVLQVDLLAAPRADLPARRRAPATADAPLIGAYATRRDDRLALVLISRRLPEWPDPRDDGATRVSVALPITHAERLTVIRTDGAYGDHNVDGPVVGLVRAERAAPALVDGEPFVVDVLPPASAAFYLFDGVSWRD